MILAKTFALTLQKYLAFWRVIFVKFCTSGAKTTFLERTHNFVIQTPIPGERKGSFLSPHRTTKNTKAYLRLYIYI